MKLPGFCQNLFIYSIICWKNIFFSDSPAEQKKSSHLPPTGPLRRLMHRFVFLGFFSGLSVTYALCNRRNAALVHVPQGSRENSCLNESITVISLDRSNLSPSLTTFTTLIWTFQSSVIIALQRCAIATLDRDVHGRKKKSEEEEEKKNYFLPVMIFSPGGMLIISTNQRASCFALSQSEPRKFSECQWVWSLRKKRQRTI